MISLLLAALVLVFLWRADVLRPGSFERAGRRPVDRLPWYIWLLAAFLVYVAMQIGGGLVLAIRPLSGGDPESLRGMAVIALGSYAAAIALSTVLIRAIISGADAFSIKTRGIVVGAGCFVLACPVIYAVMNLSAMIATMLRGAPLPEVAHKSLAQILDHRDSLWSWLLGVAAVLGAPIAEEVIYRAFLQSALLRLFGRAWPAIFITALLFTSVHIGVAEVHALPVLFTLGLAMGIAFERTRNLLVPIMMHVLFNALNVALALLLK